jgi:hypothetical protein
MNGRPAIYDDPAKMQADIDIYFSGEGKKTVTGLAIALGFESRQSMYDYKKNDRFSYIINRALLRIENQYEENLHGQNVAGSIFVLKNMGWKDRTETELSGGIDVKQIIGTVVK